MPTALAQESTTLLRTRDVAAVLGVSVSQVRRMRNGERNRRRRSDGAPLPDVEPDPTFPAPIQLGAAVRWRSDDIQRFIDGLPPVDRSAR